MRKRKPRPSAKTDVCECGAPKTPQAKLCMSCTTRKRMIEYYKDTDTPEGIAKRFWPHVDKQPSENGCWLWTGHTSDGRYGAIKVRQKAYSTHRMSWILHYGPIPDGLDVLHKCDNTRCVRPDHLFLGTPLANAQDRSQKGRTRVPKGIKLTEQNVLDIRAALAQGASLKSQAEQYRVDVSLICAIKKGKAWRRLLPPTGTDG